MTCKEALGQHCQMLFSQGGGHKGEIRAPALGGSVLGAGEGSGDAAPFSRSCFYPLFYVVLQMGLVDTGGLLMGRGQGGCEGMVFSPAFSSRCQTSFPE